MECQTCREPAVGACSRCGAFYCANHGGEATHLERAYCVACFEQMRPRLAIGGVVAFTIGLVLLYLGLEAVTRTGSKWDLLMFGLIAMGIGLFRFSGLREGSRYRSG